MEFTPRGGGNRLSEMLDMASDANLIENSIKAAVGLPIAPMTMPRYKGHLAEVILHADKNGKYDCLWIAPDIEPYVIQRDIWVNEGDDVLGFSGANHAIGTLVLRFPTKGMLDDAMCKISSWCNVTVK